MAVQPLAVREIFLGHRSTALDHWGAMLPCYVCSCQVSTDFAHGSSPLKSFRWFGPGWVAARWKPSETMTDSSLSIISLNLEDMNNGR